MLVLWVRGIVDCWFDFGVIVYCLVACCVAVLFMFVRVRFVFAGCGVAYCFMFGLPVLLFVDLLFSFWEFC